QKHRYIYYKCKHSISVCSEPYIRQEELEKAFTEAVCSLKFTPKIANQIREELIKSAKEEGTHREDKLKQLISEHDHLQRRIETAYIDKLDSRIESEMFYRMSAEWKTRQDQINTELARLEKADSVFMDKGLAILELCQRAGRLFKVQTAREKRR